MRCHVSKLKGHSASRSASPSEATALSATPRSMTVSSTFVALCYLLTVDATRLTLQHGAYKDLHKRHIFKREEQQPSRPSTNAYLNNRTQPFWVNGSALPEVKFDIGESYSGLLPIDNSKELFFWFVPSVNPAAKDEITIWYGNDEHGPRCSLLTLLDIGLMAGLAVRLCSVCSRRMDLSYGEQEPICQCRTLSPGTT